MANVLREYFPMLRSRDEILKEIQSNEELAEMFESWKEKYREEFLDFCTGAKGVKMLYDFCIKELLNPEIYPERLEELISLLLGKKVTILTVFPGDNTRISDESSLVLMDFLVQLRDGSVANVEIQKIGYAFPGPRSACYSADLLLRQYRQVRRNTAEKKFSYRKISKVYTIVLFEKSTSEFHKFPNHYVHKFKQESNTGLKMELLQEFVFVAIDIYKKNHQNKNIKNRLEGWLTFLSSDRPEDIIALIEMYPDFKAMYEQVYEICQNVEKVMEMFSKELYELDRNTVQYMIDELQEENERLKEENKRREEESRRREEESKRDKEEIEYYKEESRRQKEESRRQKEESRRQKEEIERLKKRLKIKDSI